MNHHSVQSITRAVVGASLGLMALAAGLSSASQATAMPLISEVYYDAPGSDDAQGFVELSGAPGALLDGLVLEGINGSGGSVTATIVLTGSIGADGLFVVADVDGDGTSLVPGADLLVNFDFQNGPDSIWLRDTSTDTVVDAIGYGAFDGGDVFAGEGSPAPDAPAGSSLARLFADVDTDDNAVDFELLDVPTPGVATFDVPEPSSGVLATAGLATLGWLGRRRPGSSRRSGA